MLFPIAPSPLISVGCRDGMWSSTYHCRGGVAVLSHVDMSRKGSEPTLPLLLPLS